MLAHGGGRRGIAPATMQASERVSPLGLKPMVAHVRHQRPTSFYPPAGVAGLILCALRWNPCRNMPHLENRLLWATRSVHGHVHFDHMYCFISSSCCVATQ